MPMPKVIGFTYDSKKDWKKKENDPIDINAEFDAPETIDFIAEGIEAGGYKVKRIGNVYNLLKTINNLDVDIVFNICEGKTTGRNRESQVPVLLEMYGIPFIGADALALGLTLDKVLAKKCFVADGIPTPGYFQAGSIDDLKSIKDIKFPLIVKCRFEGTSKGMTENSRVENMKDLKEQVELMTTTYDQPVIVEEFIKGKEFTVGIIGNEDPFVSPVIQISINGSVNLGNDFYTSEMVRSDDAVKYICPAKIPEKLAKQMQDLALKAYRSVDCRDLGRVDFRVDEKGNPFCLEINPLPSFSKEDVFNIFPQAIDMTFSQTMSMIIEAGLKRCGLMEEALIESN